MTAPFPLPRQTRETEILAGNGGATYGPFAFSIFDVADVVALVSRDGGNFLKEAATAAKTSLDPFAPFTVTFATPLSAVDRFQVLGRRVHERSTDVLRGGSISAAGLERELSAQAVVLQELRRDNSRATDFSDDFLREGEALLVDMRAVRGEVALDRVATGFDAIATAEDVIEARALLEQASAGFTGFPSGSAFDFGSIVDPFAFFPQNWGSL